MIAVLEVGLAMEMDNNLKNKSSQPSMDFLKTMLDENNEIKFVA